MAQRVAGLVTANVAATTGLVRFEILRGARDKRHFDQLRILLDGLHQLPVPEDLWEDAAALGIQMRRAGHVRRGSDLLIAAVALRAGAIVVHRDCDFDLIAQHSPLKVENCLVGRAL